MTSLQLAAEAQQVLQGIPLPVRTAKVVEYAQRQGASDEVLSALRGLPKKQQFMRLDDVGEALAPVQPAFAPPSVHEPRVESDRVPGGDAYTEAAPDPGWIRDQPDLLEYEEMLVRAPSDEPGGGIPKVGEKDQKPE